MHPPDMRIVLLLSAFLSGCTVGTVKVTDNDAFGLLQSAVDLQFEFAGDDIEWTSHALVATSTPNWCEKAAEGFPAAQRAWDELLLEEFPDADSWNDACNYWDGLWWELDGVLDETLHEDQTLAVFFLETADPEARVWGAPEAGSFDLDGPMEDPASARGRIDWFKEDPYDAARTGYVCGSRGFINDAVDAFLEARRSLHIRDAEFVIEPSEDDDGWDVTVEGARLDEWAAGEQEVDQDRGGLDLEGHFTPCRVELPYETSPFILL